VRVISDVVASNVGFKMSEMILDGTISNILIKPISIKAFIFLSDFGKLCFKLVSKIIVFGAIFMLLGQRWEFQIVSIGWFLMALVLCLFLSFSSYFLVGCIAFWTQDAKNINYGLQRMIFFLSGGLVPISFFPMWAQNISRFLPFEYMLNFPINLLNGNLSVMHTLVGFSIGIFWCALLWLVGNFILKISIKYNESVGI
jgi:ABC-2 type transport system permease protein